MNRSKQQDIMRLMGARQEMARQPEKNRLVALMERIDPFEEAREASEMDVWEEKAPVTHQPLINEDGELIGWEEVATQTARSPEGDEEHNTHGKTLHTELIWYDE